MPLPEPTPPPSGTPPLPAAALAARRLLLLSNSRDPEGRYLVHARDALAELLAGVREVVFVPFAGVTITWDAYAALVRTALAPLGVGLRALHTVDGGAALVRDAEALAVGGGNTFQLLAEVQRRGLRDAIRARALGGMPYVGWSAGSVIAAPTMQTTNDMPIVVPPDGLTALGLIGVQLNAHYTEVHPPGFRGETRVERLTEYVTANPTATVLGLPEGSWVAVRGVDATLGGPHEATVFRAGEAPGRVAGELGGLGV